MKERPYIFLFFLLLELIVVGMRLASFEIVSVWNMRLHFIMLSSKTPNLILVFFLISVIISCRWASKYSVRGRYHWIWTLCVGLLLLLLGDRIAKNLKSSCTRKGTLDFCGRLLRLRFRRELLPGWRSYLFHHLIRTSLILYLLVEVRGRSIHSRAASIPLIKRLCFHHLRYLGIGYWCHRSKSTCLSFKIIIS